MSQTLTRNYAEALRQLRIFTGGSYAIASLAGRHNRLERQQIMKAHDGQDVPLDRCGVNALEMHFYAMAGVDLTAMTLHAAELQFIEWAHANGDTLDVVQS